MRIFAAFLLSGALTVAAAGQAATPADSPLNQVLTSPQAPPAGVPSSRAITVPAGTKVLLQLKSPIDTKSAHVGDGVYCQTSFPVTQNNVVVIPAGTYVKGEIAHVERAGRIKGRAQILFHFDTMIFPNGYTVDLPGALKNEPGATNSTVSDEEGTVKANGQKGKDAGTVAKTGATGAVVGTVATRTGTGAAIGGLAGAAVGLGQVLFTRGQDVRIEQGTSLEMVLQRPLTVEVNHPDSAQAADNDVRPRITNSHRLREPKRPPQ
jgi:type IV secretion system protein VirB10